MNPEQGLPEGLELLDANQARAVFESLIASLPGPHELDHRVVDGVLQVRHSKIYEGEWQEYLHPIYAFAHHFRGHDSGSGGYSSVAVRGDSHTIPMYAESFPGILAISTGFHKGQMVQKVDLWKEPVGPRLESYKLALKLLEKFETR